MAYTRKQWIDNKTKLNAANLNNIEQGIEEATAKAKEAFDQANANLEVINGHSGTFDDIGQTMEELDRTIYNNNLAINSYVDSVESRVGAAELKINTLASTSELTRITEIIAGHTANQSNPHTVTAEQVGAYSKSDIDTILDPVCTITKTNVDGIYTFSCPNISTHKHYLKLELNDCNSSIFGNNCLWNIDVGDETTSFSSTNNQLPNSIDDILNNYNATLGTLTGELFYEPNALERADIQFSALNPDIPFDGLTIDTSNSTDYESISIYLALYNSDLKKVYILGLGSPRSNSMDFNCVIKDNKLYYAKMVDKTSEIIDLPKNTHIAAIGIKREDASYDIKIKDADLANTSFTLYDQNGQNLASATFYTNGTYFIPYEGTATSIDISGELSFAQNITANYQLSYLRNDSSLARLTQLVPECEITADTISSEVQKNLQFFITSGTADPDTNTPGQFYFKYLL